MNVSREPSPTAPVNRVQKGSPGSASGSATGIARQQGSQRIDSSSQSVSGPQVQLPSKSKRTTSPPEGPNSKRPRITLARLNEIPTEIAEAILARVPNGAPNRVTSLARTSKHLYSIGLDKTRAKAKASDLIDRAKQIHNLRPDGTTIGGFYEVRLAEFSSILESAKDIQIPLRGKDLVDVFVALSSELDSLGFSESAGRVLMLETLEGLGSTWNRVTVNAPQEREIETRQLDEAKYEIFGLLSKGWGMSFAEEIRGPCFDRLCSVLQAIETPAVMSRAAGEMHLGEWYFWYPENIGVERFGKLLAFAENNVDKINDYSKAKAVIRLTPKLAQYNEDPYMSRDFSRLCNIAASINKDDDAKADATVYLIERGDWLPEGAARTAARGELATIVASIASPSAKARAEAAQPIPQSP